MHWEYYLLTAKQYKMGMGLEFKQNKTRDGGISCHRVLGFSQIWVKKLGLGSPQPS